MEGNRTVRPISHPTTVLTLIYPTELAALTGMGNPNGASLFPGRDTPSVRSYNGRRTTPQKPFDPTEDDQIDHKASASHTEQSHYVVAPSIHVQSEFPTLTRTAESSQPLTCLVVVELPGKRQNTHVPGSVMPQADTYTSPKSPGMYRDGSNHSVHSGPQSADYAMSPKAQSIPMDQQSQSGRSHHMSPSASRDPLIPHSPVEREVILQDEDSPFSAITEDLRNRIIDWKGHPLSGLGPLQMYDLLSVRRDALVREFFVYLFKEAIICVVEEKKRSLGRLLSSASAASAFGDGTGSGSLNGGSTQRGVLRLKGRIYIRHIRQVTDTSVTGELSLTIDMEDERLDSFILIFKDRSSLETWKAHIQALVAIYQQQQHASVQSSQPDYGRSPDLEEFGGSAKAARMLSEEFGGSQKAMRMLSGSTTGTTVSTGDSLLNGSARSTASSNTSYGSASLGPRAGLPHQKLSTLDEDDELGRYSSPTPLVAPHLSAGPSNSLQPLPHAPMDLVLVVSVPGPAATPSTAALKIRVIKTSLDFLLAALSPKDRLSLVTFEVGIGGRVRRTPFLSVGKPQSRQRLARFMDDIGRREDHDDEFLIRGSQEDKTDVVTAVNNGACLPGPLRIRPACRL